MSLNSKMGLKKKVISNFTVTFANIFTPRSIPIYILGVVKGYLGYWIFFKGS